MSFQAIFSARKSGGQVQITMKDVLAVIAPNHLHWAIFDFDGMGNGPRGMLMYEFWEGTKKLPNGVVLSWPELVAFADGLIETHDVLIVGAETLSLLDGDRFYKKNDFKGCNFVVELFDSEDWTVWTKDHIVAAEMAERFGGRIEEAACFKLP